MACIGLLVSVREIGGEPSYGLKQEFIIPHCPQQNWMVERVIRPLKEQCVHGDRFESHVHATRVIGDWITFYNQRHPDDDPGLGLRRYTNRMI